MKCFVQAWVATGSILLPAALLSTGLGSQLGQAERLHLAIGVDSLY